MQSQPKAPKGRVFRLLFSILGLYSSFLLWGYLQERLSSTDYNTTLENGASSDGSSGRWKNVVVLNFFMALSSTLISLPFVIYESLSDKESAGGGLSVVAPKRGLAPASMSNCLASPFGYLSLNYINYPMLLLAKSSKLVPVMLLSYIINGKRYSASQIFSVALISLGVALFSCKKNPSVLFAATDSSTSSNEDSLKTFIGLGLVLINLLLDGFTNARQDKFKLEQPKTSSFTMMYQMNIWQCVFMGSYLLIELGIASYGGDIVGIHASQLEEALAFAVKFPAVVKDVFLFCITGASGQVFIFYIITEFGSLVCVLVTVTRKFFSILLSVIIFGHTVQWWQWIGVTSVFAGLLMNSIDKYLAKQAAAKEKKE